MSVVFHIIKNKAITEYMERHGHFPVKEMSGGRITYLCPFPDHKESKPSFFVWTNTEYQNFYCFGCQRKHHIIHLVSGLENISYSQAVKLLSDGMEITLEDDINTELLIFDKQYQKRFNYQLDNYQRDIGIVLSNISSLCFAYLRGVNNDRKEIDIIDKLYADIDRDIIDCQFDKIEETHSCLPKILQQRLQQYHKNAIRTPKNNTE